MSGQNYPLYFPVQWLLNFLHFLTDLKVMYMYLCSNPSHFLYIIAQKKQLGISGFGISITTMEEVFIKVGENNTEELAHTESKSIIDTIRAESALMVDDVDTGYPCK